MGLSEIVNIVISRQTTQVATKSFATTLILGTHTNFAGRVKTYTNTDDMIADGFLTTDPEVKAATKLLSQTVKPEKFKVGRKDAGDADLAATLAAVSAEDDDWYALIYETHAEADINAIAVVIEAQEKIYLTSSLDAAVITNSSTDVASDLNLAGYDRTFIIYSADTANFPEAAVAGGQLPKVPGSYTVKFKTLKGIVADNLNASQKGFALGKKANVYTPVGGVDILSEGTMASGEFFDTIVGIDWLKARMQERVYSSLVNEEKIPFTDAGIASVEGMVRATLQEGVNNGLLASFTTSVPKAADVSSVNKLARTLPDVKFEAVLAGAVHKVTINGVVTV